ncbi:MAG: Zn-dependent hydrolase [Gammaproteobacteria bacterium]|nr:Zn-dependent hydrolase [Gammaproteobacteria bacterium]
MLKINSQRLQSDIDTLAGIGRAENHGLYRQAFSDNDMLARQWFCQRIEQAQLQVHIDGAANIHARLGEFANNKPSVMTGSHLDTIPGAGHLDGALGVLSGLECLRVIQEQGLSLTYPLEVVSFSDEEGRFGGMFGSQAIAGQLTPKRIYDAVDPDGLSISDAMQAHGLNAMDALNANRPPESLKAFVELHIEQGPVLHRQGLSVGIVEGINGLFKWLVRLKGQANHAGSTPMDMRRDAFHGLAEVAMQVDRVLEENGSARSVATIGHVQLSPGAANVIPGVAEFTLEVRDIDEQVLEILADAFRRTISAIARRRDLMFEFEVLSRIHPVKCDRAIQEVIKQHVLELGCADFTMPSGAAHDSQIMATITPAAMIFVPSKEGRSHSPDEWTAWEDIEQGANVLLNTLYTLAK